MRVENREIAMRKSILSILIISGFATAAWAESNEAIVARQDAMSEIGKSMKVLGSMAKGEAEFDHDAAQTALSTIHTNALQLPDLFPEDSMTGTGHEEDGVPKETEALPAIWENREEFDALVQKFITDTEKAVMADPQDAASLGAAMGMFAEDCKACHQDFRVKKN